MRDELVKSLWKEKNNCLLWELQIFSVGTSQNFSISKLVVYIEPMGFEGLMALKQWSNYCRAPV
jgi:hypothetical protein